MRDVIGFTVPLGFNDVTSIWTFRYRGKTYFAEDFGDAGSWGDRELAIFKWNDEKKRYDLFAEM